jgi:hypothetical protein
MILNLLTEELHWHRRDEWDKTVSGLSNAFREKPAYLAGVIHNAITIRETLHIVDPYIQQNTSVVCPCCERVCCINKHGYYDYQDLIYIAALGEQPPSYQDGMGDTEACQFLSLQGCVIDRAVRPFRCNWYFCDALVTHMQQGPGRPYREFSIRFQQIQTARRLMIEEFFNQARLFLKK